MRYFIHTIPTVLFVLCAVVNAQNKEELSVKLGEVKSNVSAAVNVNFVEVIDDSRCPTGANCIWAGRARIKVTLEQKNGDPVTVEFSTEPNHGGAAIGGYRIHFIKLDPHPSAETAPEEKEYTASFSFQKL